MPSNRRKDASLKETLSEILPFETSKQILKSPGMCVASLITRPNEKCSYRAKGAPVTLRKQLKQLSAQKGYMNTAQLLEKVEDIICSAECGVHRNAALRRVKKVRNIVKEASSSKHCARKSMHQESYVLRKLSKWIKALCGSVKEHTAPARHTDPVQQHKEPRSPNVKVSSPLANKHIELSTHCAKDQALGEFLAADYDPVLVVTPSVPGDASILRPRPYQSQQAKQQSTRAALQTLISKPLTTDELASGFIYVFELDGMLSYIKIGKSKDPEMRLRQWIQQCRLPYRFLEDPYGNGKKFETELVGRVERLIHTELKDYQVAYDCPGCGITHHEWFRVSSTHAMAVIRKYIDFVKKKSKLLGSKRGCMVFQPHSP